MPQVNAVGDLVLTHAREFRALAHPLAIAATDRLRRAGPATSAALSEALDATEADLDARLAELERVGIVTRDEDGWSAVAKGFVFEIPEDAEGQTAARALTNVMLLQYVDLPRQWVADTEPDLELEWVRAAGLFNARVALTPDELRGFQEELEELLAAYLTRDDERTPPDARRVRILGYFMPDSAPD